MSAIRVTLTGEKEMKKRLQAIARESSLAARRGSREWAQEKLVIAQDRCPVKTGRLKNSGKVRISIKKAPGKENISASIVFGGAEAPYAAKVHETHKTQSKWVETTMNEALPTALPEIAAKIDVKKAAMAR